MSPRPTVCTIEILYYFVMEFFFFLLAINLVSPEHTHHAHLNSTLHLVCAGARLHHFPPEEGDASNVWQGGEEERVDSKSARDLPSVAAGAPDLPGRLPQGAAHAGGPRPPGLHQVPCTQAQAHRTGLASVQL